ncbi:DUF461 domain-containing protein [Streptomyces sp. NPDC052682]|uniref:DUF461 domain-containing protein n=1 Tax=Streptomyces sp. NPDC052682 TaxID=3154954 RepID=UPI0034454D61
MSSSLRRGALAAAAIAFSIASLAACGAGHNAQTLQIQPDNAATTVGDLKIQNAIVVTQKDPEATGPAMVSATVFNSGSTDQKLESISVDGAGSAKLTPAKGGSLTVPAHGSLIIGGKDNASAVLPSGREALQDGNVQQVTFTFSESGEVRLKAFVHPADGYYAAWGPSETPATPGASASPSEKPSAGASASPGETPGGSASPHDSASASASASESPAGH